MARTSTVFSLVPPGTRTRHVVVDSQAIVVAVLAPNVNTVVLPGSKPLPVIVASAPPERVPVFGLTFVTVGWPYLKLAFATTGLTPPPVITVTLTLAEVPAGAVAVSEVGLSCSMDVPYLEPNRTPVASVRFRPVIVTTVPPLDGPFLGVTVVTVGVGPCGRSNSHAAPTSLSLGQPINAVWPLSESASPIPNPPLPISFNGATGPSSIHSPSIGTNDHASAIRLPARPPKSAEVPLPASAIRNPSSWRGSAACSFAPCCVQPPASRGKTHAEPPRK